MTTARPAAPDAITSLPSWLLGRAAARGHRLVAEALAQEGMRMMHHAVLTAIAEQEPVSQAQLSRSLGIDPKEVVGLVNDLERDGLVARGPDPADRRKNAVDLSARGRDRLRRTRRHGEEANDVLTAALSPAERRLLTGLLARIIDPGADRQPNH